MSMTAIQVKYEFIDGHHVFTSQDVHGLLVVSDDPETAFGDVAESIETILELSEGVSCTAKPLQSLSEFLNGLKGEGEVLDQMPILTSQRYALACT